MRKNHSSFYEKTDEKRKEFKGDGRNENQLKIYTNVAFEISKRSIT